MLLFTWYSYTSPLFSYFSWPMCSWMYTPLLSSLPMMLYQPSSALFMYTHAPVVIYCWRFVNLAQLMNYSRIHTHCHHHNFPFLDPYIFRNTHATIICTDDALPKRLSWFIDTHTTNIVTDDALPTYYWRCYTKPAQLMNYLCTHTSLLSSLADFAAANWCFLGFLTY